MADFARMVFLANCFRPFNLLHLRQWRGNGDVPWVEESGFRYCPLDPAEFPPPLGYMLARYFGPKVFQGLAFECVEVMAEIKPHHHRRSDGVICCDKSAESHLGYFDLHGSSWGCWVKLDAGQVIALPRGTNHGFKTEERGGNFFLLAINEPGIQDDDVVYV